jgi:hypothetical protein
MEVLEIHPRPSQASHHKGTKNTKEEKNNFTTEAQRHRERRNEKNTSLAKRKNLKKQFTTETRRARRKAKQEERICRQKGKPILEKCKILTNPSALPLKSSSVSLCLCGE